MARASASRLEEALEELRVTPPKQFTARRAALAETLAKEGLKDEASEVKRVRKQPASVWALGELARRKKDALQDVLSAGDEVRKQQRAAVSGAGAGSLREASRRFQEAVTAATQAAATLIRGAGESASTAVLDRIRDTLLASAEASEEERRALREGDLEADLAPTGFGNVAALRVVPPPKQRKTRASAKDDQRAARDEERVQREEVKRRQQILAKELQQKERAVRAAESEQGRLERFADSMEQKANDARDRAKAAAKAAAVARRELDRLRKKADSAP